MAHIFVVDDDEQLLRMVGLMLERGGHTATLISNPLDGLERIKNELPDLAILDVMMPGMSGHDVCRHLRMNEETTDMPLLILTARAQETDVRHRAADSLCVVTGIARSRGVLQERLLVSLQGRGGI